MKNTTYVYDHYGNRQTVTASGAAADGSAIPIDGYAQLSYNLANNRITTAGFEYDAAGNQTRGQAADGSWIRMQYDYANRLEVITDDGGTAKEAYQFAPSGTRLMNTNYTTYQTTFYANLGGTTLAEYVEFTYLQPTWIKSYTYFGDSLLSTISNSNNTESIEFNHPDRLGTRTITNQATGASYNQNTLPFGTALNAESTVQNNKKRFTSYDRSSITGLDYAVNRTYDSKQGRFTQVDPIGMGASSLASPQTLNLYAYCGNDPINHTDPSGLFWGSLFRWIGKSLLNLVKRVVYAAVKAAITAAFTYITSGGNFGAAVAAFIGAFVINLAFPKFGNVLTPSWNPNVRHPLSGGSGLSNRHVIRNFVLNSSQINVFSTIGSVANFLAIIFQDGKEGEDYCKSNGKERYFKNPADLSDDIKNSLRTAMEREGLGWSVFHKDGPKNFNSLSFLILMESDGKVDAKNNSSSARGLMQLTKINYKLNPNGEKSFGNAVEEIQGGIRYIKQRYGTPQKAREFWKKNCYY